MIPFYSSFASLSRIFFKKYIVDFLQIEDNMIPIQESKANEMRKIIHIFIHRKTY